MATSSEYRALQEHAISYVQSSRKGIFAAAKEINPKINPQDLDDLVSDGYVIALEIIESGNIGELETLFWSKLKRSIWDAYDYIIAFDHIEDRKILPPSLTVPAEEPFEKIYKEQEFVSMTASVLDFLSPSEKRVLCLVLGLTSRGICGVTEAATILGLSRMAARTLYDRILVKVNLAVRHVAPAGWTVLSRGRPRSRTQCRRKYLSNLSPPFSGIPSADNI